MVSEEEVNALKEEEDDDNDLVNRYSGVGQKPQVSTIGTVSFMSNSDTMMYRCSICNSVCTEKSVYCFVCKEAFCEECDKVVHAERTKFSSHKREHFNKIKKNHVPSIGPILSEEKLGKCERHGKDFVMYCKEDGSFCCPDCLMGTKHVGHTLFNIVLNSKDILESFLLMKSTVNVTPETIYENMRLLDEQRKAYEESYNRAKFTIEKMYSDLESKVNEREKSLLKVRNTENSHIASKGEIEEEIRHIEGEIENAMREIEGEIHGKRLDKKEFCDLSKESIKLLEDEIEELSKKDEKEKLTKKDVDEIKKVIIDTRNKIDENIGKLESELDRLSKLKGGSESEVQKRAKRVRCINTIIVFMEGKTKVIDAFLGKVEMEMEMKMEMNFKEYFLNAKQKLSDLKKELYERAYSDSTIDVIDIVGRYKELSEKLQEFKKASSKVECPVSFTMSERSYDLPQKFASLVKISQSIDPNGSRITWTKGTGKVLIDTQKTDEAARSTSDAPLYTPTPAAAAAANTTSAVSPYAYGSMPPAPGSENFADWFFNPLGVRLEREEDKTPGTYRSKLQNAPELNFQMFNFPKRAQISHLVHNEEFREFRNIRMEFISRFAAKKAREIISKHLLERLGVRDDVLISFPTPRVLFRAFFVETPGLVKTFVDEIERAPDREFSSAHEDVKRAIDDAVTQTLAQMRKGRTEESFDGYKVLMLSGNDARLPLAREVERQVKYYYRSYDGEKVVFLVPKDKEDDLLLRVEREASNPRICDVGGEERGSLKYWAFTFKGPDPSRVKDTVAERLKKDCPFPCWHTVLRNNNDYRLVVSCAGKDEAELRKTSRYGFESISSSDFVSYFKSEYCYCDIDSL